VLQPDVWRGTFFGELIVEIILCPYFVTISSLNLLSPNQKADGLIFRGAVVFEQAANGYINLSWMAESKDELDLCLVSAIRSAVLAKVGSRSVFLLTCGTVS
jgi:hypothetical protein